MITEKLLILLKVININILPREQLDKVFEFILARSLTSYQVFIIVTLNYNKILKYQRKSYRANNIITQKIVKDELRNY